MNRHNALLEQLRTTGHRLTPQRAMVLSVLAESRDHLSVDEVYQRVRQVYPFVDLATVYRTLQLLAKLHIATAIEEPPGMRYELVRAEDRHHHMVCEECGGAFDLPPHYLEALKEQLVREVGFEPHMEHFTIHGMCARCLSGQGKRTT